MTIQRLREILKTLDKFEGATSIIDKLDEENKLLRRHLWLTHGCNIKHLYGDDGEMQCLKCVIDFKRYDVKTIIEQIQIRNTNKYFEDMKEYFDKRSKE